MLAFSVVSVMIVPLWSLIAGIIFLFPFRLFTYLYISDQQLPSFRSTDRKNVSCAVLLAASSSLDSLFSYIGYRCANYLLYYTPLKFILSRFIYLLYPNYTRGCWELNDYAVDCTVWRTHFGRV